MKKLLVFIILLLTVPAFAGEITGGSLSGMTISKSATPAPEEPAGSQCNDAVDYAGIIDTDHAVTFTLTAKLMLCNLHAPACTSEGCSETGGFLEDAVIKTVSPLVTTNYATVAVYADDGDSAPNAGDALIGSVQVAGTSSCAAVEGGDFYTCQAKLTGTDLSVNCSDSLWLCFISDDNNRWASRRTNSSALAAYSRVLGAYSVPATLDGSWTTTASRAYQIQATIGAGE